MSEIEGFLAVRVVTDTPERFEREAEPTPESKVKQGPVWLCFRTPNPKVAHSGALSRGANLPSPPVPTSFGSEAFFANDPMGLPIYVGTAWRSPRS